MLVFTEEACLWTDTEITLAGSKSDIFRCCYAEMARVYQYLPNCFNVMEGKEDALIWMTVRRTNSRDSKGIWNKVGKEMNIRKVLVQQINRLLQDLTFPRRWLWKCRLLGFSTDITILSKQIKPITYVSSYMDITLREQIKFSLGRD